MILLFYFLLFLFSFTSTTTYSINSSNKQKLTSQQWSDIKNILKSNSASYKMKQTVQQMIYIQYEGYAVKKACDFKKFHRYKCRHIPINELTLYSKLGLYKAIKKYNPDYHFTYHASIYIDYELYKGMTDLFPITSVPKKDRIYKKQFSIHYLPANYTSDDKTKLYLSKFLYKKQLHTKFLGKDDWMIEKKQPINEYPEQLDKIIHQSEFEDVWLKSQKLNRFQKRILYLKYDIYFNQIRSNKQVAELMACSEEYVRQQGHLLKDVIYK
jgi:DNA-directed RNA polymerase sigma subunit (sigma70/sigma32)